MTDRSSSPFLDQPSRTNFSPQHSREAILRLEYELSALKTEKKLLQQSKESSIARYEELLTRKNEELASLQSNFDFLYNQRKELQSKVQNQQDTAGKTAQDLSNQVKSLKMENKSLLSKVDKLERSYQTMAGKCEHLRVDYNRELSTNDQLREKLTNLESENKRLSHENESSLDRIQMLSSQMEKSLSKRITDDLQLRIVSLQKTNNQLQFKIDSLLQSKTSVELLKQKNASLLSRLSSLEASKERVAELEMENKELKARFDEFFGSIASTVEGDDNKSDNEVVTDFIQSFKHLQNKNLVLLDTLNQTQAKLSESEQTLRNTNNKIQTELLPQLQDLQEQNASKEKQIAELLKSKVLNSKEIEFLRTSLKDMDEITSKQKYVPGSAPSNETEENTTMNQYLSNLEKLVDEYKQEIDQLRSKHNQANHGPSIPSKRPRLVESDDISIRNINTLRRENLDLSSEIKDLQDELASLKKKLDLAQEANKRSSIRILELRDNPFNKDQLIKQETLDLLRKENRDLVSKLIESKEVDSIPKSIFARQENDKDLLQTKVDGLTKKLNRLKTVYTDKSRDIIAIISRFFGYSIEFIANPINPNEFCSKIKLTSKYMTQKDSNTSTPYLVIDVQTKTLKANGNYKFKTICEELVNQWVNEKSQIPCFLSALNLRIYEEYGKPSNSN